MKDLTSGPIAKGLVTLSIPIILANLLQSMYQMIDTFWVGRLGAEAVAAVSLTFPVLFLAFSIGIGLALAATVLVSQAAGRKDKDRQDLIATQSYTTMILFGSLLGVVGYALSGFFMSLIGAEGQVLELATRYLQVSFIGVPFLFGFAIYQSIVRGIGEVRAPLYIVFGTVLLNLVLDPLFIYGWGPLEPAGVAGAAMASVVTQAISAIVGLALLLRGRAGVHLRAAYVRIRPEIQRLIFSIGIPSSLNSAARGISFIAMAAIVAGISTTAIAAYGIGQRVFSFVIIPALGFAIATSTVVGQNVGARRNDRVIETIKAAVGIAFTSLTAIGALLVIFAPRIVAFFVPGEAAVIAMGSRFLRIAGLTFGLIGIQMIVSGALRGADAPRAALYITLINLFVIQVPLAWLLAHTSLAATGVWISIAAANLVAAIIALVWFRVKDWHAVEPA